LKNYKTYLKRKSCFEIYFLFIVFDVVLNLKTFLKQPL